MKTLYRLICDGCSFRVDIAGHEKAQRALTYHEELTGHNVVVYKKHSAGQCLWPMFNFKHKELSHE